VRCERGTIDARDAMRGRGGGDGGTRRLARDVVQWIMEM